MCGLSGLVMLCSNHPSRHHPTVSSACSTRSNQKAALSRMQLPYFPAVGKRVPGAMPIPFFRASS